MQTLNTGPLSGVHVVFDLDGTLIHTAPDLQAALNHVLTAYDYAPVLEEVTESLIGHGAKAMLRAGLNVQNISVSADTLNEMFDLFLTHYADNIDTHSRPFPGCLNALARLKAAGAILSVCTNKTQKLADNLLVKLDIAKEFAAIIGADSVPARKPDGGHILATLEAAGSALNQTPTNQAPADQSLKAIMVGDSQTDERAARNARLPFLYVPFGYDTLDEVSLTEGRILHHYDHLTVNLVKDILKRNP